MKIPGADLEKDSERMHLLLLALGVNAEGLARELGKERGDIVTNVLRKKNGISRNLVGLITRVHPEINPVWLWEGSGDMFLTDRDGKSIVPVPVSSCDACREKDEIIRQYKELKEEAVGQLRALLAEKDKTIELLNSIIRDCRSRR
jgi:hypothetical protein